ncbi:unnamed protein product, partial [Mesorhabditis belari]|uniref:Uncharacterized protein n=1 Tax=Mesorhabditis belari TaxID=2138241 RepID=A0AAF3FLH4_9BILA
MEFDEGMIVRRLVDEFKTASRQRALNGKEQKIADYFVRILQEAKCGSMIVESEEEFEEESGMNTDDECWDIDDTPQSALIAADSMVNFDGTLISTKQLHAAISHLRSSQKGMRTLSSMTSRFRWIKTKDHMNRLRVFEKNQAAKMNRICQLKRIRDILAEDVEKKLMEGIALHDYDLRQIEGLPSSFQRRVSGIKIKFELKATYL